MPDLAVDPAHEAIIDLAESAGLDRVMAVEPLPASGNNRVFRVVTRSSSILVKRYFARPTDTRDRLDTEFRFADFVSKAAPGSGPRRRDCVVGGALASRLDVPPVQATRRGRERKKRGARKARGF